MSKKTDITVSAKLTRVNSDLVFNEIQIIMIKYHVPYKKMQSLLRKIHNYGMSLLHEGVLIGKKQY